MLQPAFWLPSKGSQWEGEAVGVLKIERNLGIILIIVNIINSFYMG